jgi:precorrin-6B methylase 2
MEHADHVGLIRAGMGALPGGAPLRRWLELGAGEGAFTLALADLLGPGAEITAIDRDAAALRRLGGEMAARFPGRG